GQKQRVLLARAICQQPKILVLDEPTSYLDLKHKLQLLQKLTEYVKTKQVAALLSLHELEIARNISDTVVALGDGQVLKIGSPKEVFTEGFIRKLYHIEDMDATLLGSAPWMEGSTAAVGSMTMEVVPEKPEMEDTESAKSEIKDTVSVETGAIESAICKSGTGKRAKAIMVQGTMSGAGKSMIAAGLCRIFADDGYRVAPFKSQNMALNSFITEDGLEMGRAQVMQAECAKIRPQAAMNPILLKPTSDTGSQVIINGKAIGNMKAAEYYQHKKDFKKDILKAYDSLAENADIIVIEGAGSPVEMNLKQDDIVNMGMADMVDAPVLLVGDIDRGGVFAQLFGTMELLEPAEKERVKGLIVNKFRGDVNLFADGVKILEEKTGAKVIGVVPYMNVRLDDEDSLSERFRNSEAKAFDIAIIKLDHISNFTDFDPFEQIEDISLRYVTDAGALGSPDLIILPGSKNTIADLRKIQSSGLAEAVKRKAAEGTCIIGICGGYQMLGRKIEDPEATEDGGSEEGLGLLPVDTVLESEKTTKQVVRKITHATGVLTGMEGTAIEGYEIHNGKTIPFDTVTEFTEGQTGFCSGNVYGTYLHGFFDKKEILSSVLKKLADANKKELATDNVEDYAQYKDKQYDLLAKGLRESLDMEYIYRILDLQ
ncbi:MAG: cobyric acid synthase, partial [Lachnospiraceae bacterium]|nr:cobyric acid synthase [Lachnospiraceae bacterium]